MQNMHSKDYERFYESFFGDKTDSWRDGPDLESLRHLKDEEKLNAEQLLINNVGCGDSWIPMGLVAIKSELAIEKLKAVLDKVDGKELVYVALALWKLIRFKNADQYITKVLYICKSYFDRIDAAIALGTIDTELSIVCGRKYSERKYEESYALIGLVRICEG